MAISIPCRSQSTNFCNHVLVLRNEYNVVKTRTGELSALGVKTRTQALSFITHQIYVKAQEEQKARENSSFQDFIDAKPEIDLDDLRSLKGLSEKGLINSPKDFSKLIQWIQDLRSGAAKKLKEYLFMSSFFAEIVKAGIPKEFLPSIAPESLEFVDIKPASFMMGSPDRWSEDYDSERYPDERLHSATIPNWLKVQKTKLTQIIYFGLTGKNPSWFSKKEFCPDTYIEIHGVGICPNHPVDNIKPVDAKQLIEIINNKANEFHERHRLKILKADLPTETEWEYFTRAGSTTPYVSGTKEKLSEFITFNKNSARQSQPVAKLKPNSFGVLLDGGIRELTKDVSVRGGYWGSEPQFCRSAYRTGYPDDPTEVGLRLVLRFE